MILNDMGVGFQFQYKEFVLLFAGLAIFAILFFALMQWKKKVTKRMGDKNLVRALVGNFSSRMFTTKFLFLSAAFAFGVVAVMNLRKPDTQDNIKRKGIDVAIALDVSKSMLATDLQPNRLERAKQFISKLINEMSDDRIALILFAGKAYLQMPLTVDHGAAQMYVSSASPDAVPQQGTMISDALNMSAMVFDNEDKRFKAVVLISDGEDHDENSLKTAKELSEKGVMINAVGIGSPEGTTLIDPATNEIKKDLTGNVVISKLNEVQMKSLAIETNGIYLRLQSSEEAVNALMKQLAQIERKAFSDVSLLNYKTYYMWFAGAMFLLLLAEIFISERKKIAV